MFGVLNVYLKNRFAGQFSWESERNVYDFRYDADYAATPGAEPLSFALPLQIEPFDSDRAYNYFANLLPPVVVRKKLEKFLHVSKNNVFGFLNAIGGDCAGAVSLYAPGSKTYFDGEERLRKLSDAEATDVLKSLRRRPLYAAAETGYRYSGAGAQDKLVARIEGDALVLPLFGTPSTHIVKPGAEYFPESVANEHFCQQLAARLGLNASESRIMLFGGERYYVTTRYDRERIDGKTQRLHQEDFCQMLSVDPEVKYEEDGGPGIVQCLDVLGRQHVPLAETLGFLDMVLFNCLIGNGDAHAKNYSVVYRNGSARLAPLYDAVSTLVYPELSREFAMSVAGDRSFDDITRESFVRLAPLCGISPKLVLSRLNALAARIVPAARDLAADLAPEWPSEVYAKIISVISRQVARLSGDGREKVARRV